MPLVPLEDYHPHPILCYGPPGMTKHHARDGLRFGAANTCRSQTRAECHGPPSTIALPRSYPKRSRGRAGIIGPCLRRLPAIAPCSKKEKPVLFFSQTPTKTTKTTRPHPGSDNVKEKLNSPKSRCANEKTRQKDAINAKIGKKLPATGTRTTESFFALLFDHKLRHNERT